MSFEKEVRDKWGHVAILPSPDETGFVVFNNTGIRLSGPGYHPTEDVAWKAAFEFIPKDNTEYHQSVCWESHQVHRPDRATNPNAHCFRCGETWPDAMYYSLCNPEMLAARTQLKIQFQQEDENLATHDVSNHCECRRCGLWKDGCKQSKCPVPKTDGVSS